MATPSFEADLLAARERAGVTIEQIQQDTRIPADVIERFEGGRLLRDPAFNEVYLKAFVQAYASAIGLVPNTVLEAYAMERAGGYQGQLHPDYAAPTVSVVATEEEEPPLTEERAALAPEPDVIPAPHEEPPAATPEPDEPDAPSEESPLAEASPEKEAAPPAVAALAASAGEDETSRVKVQPDASRAPITPRRSVTASSSRGRSSSVDRSWGMILGATAVTVLAVAAVLWFLFRDTTPTPDRSNGDEPIAADTAAVEGAQADSSATTVASSAPRLDLPIRVTVVAGGNGLQNFRVTEAPNDRLGHWIEPGATPTFESSQELTLWGEGANGLNPAEVTLRMQGFEWQPPQGQVLRITPANGQQLLDSLAALRPTSP